MSSAAPMIEDPTDQLLTALPFMSPFSGILCHNVISHIVNEHEAPDSAENAQVLMLHLHAKNGPVLLEMAPTVVGTGHERCVVLTGREVNADLAGLISMEGASIDDDDDDGDDENTSGLGFRDSAQQ